MKFKLDENIGLRGLELLQAAGHDVTTVRQQDLGGATDETLFATCADEGRALITLDHDFGQVTRFPPEQSAGVIIIEAGPRTTESAILGRLLDFLAVLRTQPVAGSLWIVEPGRVMSPRLEHDDVGSAAKSPLRRGSCSAAGSWMPARPEGRSASR